MAKHISRMGLDPVVVHRLKARQVHTAKDALRMSELELMELLDIPLDRFKSVVSCISDSICPPCRTVLSILTERVQNEVAMGHLSTLLPLLDNGLCGGIPFGAVTELVGPAGVGKTQFCLMLSVRTITPPEFDGLGGGVVYIDTERKFSASRMIEIGRYLYPDCFSTEERIRELAMRVIILTPSSARELVECLQQLEVMIIEHRAKLLIIDSMATLLEGDNEEEMLGKQELLGQQASLLKYLAESFRMPVVVTNHVRTAAIAEADKGVEQVQTKGSEAELLAALGTKWAHAVNIRLVMELREGRRCIRIAKCPMSAPLAVPYAVTPAGITMDGTEALAVNEQDVMAVYQEYAEGPDSDEELLLTLTSTC